MPRRVRPFASLAAALVIAIPGPAVAEGEVRAGAELGAGVDTNPRRILGGSASADGFLLATVDLRASLAGERLGGWASLAEAGRLYLTAGDATAGASRLDLQLRYAASGRLSLGADAAASDLTERGHLLDRDTVRAAGWGAWAGDGWGAQLRAGWSLFAPRGTTLRPFLAAGPEAALRLSWAPARDHLLSAGYDFWAAAYGRWGELAGGTRDDRTHTVSAEYGYRGDLVATLGYAFSWNRSTAAGGDFQRHRATARAAAFLPWEVTAAARVVLQWSRYPQPLYLPQQLLLAEGQEDLDSLELRLTRPVAGPVEVTLAAAVYHASAAQAGGGTPTLDRAVVSLGLAWRGAWERP